MQNNGTLGYLYGVLGHYLSYFWRPGTRRANPSIYKRGANPKYHDGY